MVKRNWVKYLVGATSVVTFVAVGATVVYATNDPGGDKAATDTVASSLPSLPDEKILPDTPELPDTAKVEACASAGDTKKCVSVPPEELPDADAGDLPSLPEAELPTETPKVAFCLTTEDTPADLSECLVLPPSMSDLPSGPPQLTLCTSVEGVNLPGLPQEQCAPLSPESLTATLTSGLPSELPSLTSLRLPTELPSEPPKLTTCLAVDEASLKGDLPSPMCVTLPPSSLVLPSEPPKLNLCVFTQGVDVPGLPAERCVALPPRSLGLPTPASLLGS